MSSPDSMKTIRQCDIIFRNDDYGPGLDASDTESVTDADEWMTVLETGEERMKLLRMREAYTGYVDQQKGDLRRMYCCKSWIAKH